MGCAASTIATSPSRGSVSSPISDVHHKHLDRLDDSIDSRATAPGSESAPVRDSLGEPVVETRQQEPDREALVFPSAMPVEELQQTPHIPDNMPILVTPVAFLFTPTSTTIAAVAANEFNTDNENELVVSETNTSQLPSPTLVARSRSVSQLQRKDTFASMGDSPSLPPLDVDFAPDDAELSLGVLATPMRNDVLRAMNLRLMDDDCRSDGDVTSMRVLDLCLAAPSSDGNDNADTSEAAHIDYEAGSVVEVSLSASDSEIQTTSELAEMIAKEFLAELLNTAASALPALSVSLQDSSAAFDAADDQIETKNDEFAASLVTEWITETISAFVREDAEIPLTAASLPALPVAAASEGSEPIIDSPPSQLSAHTEPDHVTIGPSLSLPSSLSRNTHAALFESSPPQPQSQPSLQTSVDFVQRRVQQVRSQLGLRRMQTLSLSDDADAVEQEALVDENVLPAMADSDASLNDDVSNHDSTDLSPPRAAWIVEVGDMSPEPVSCDVVAENVAISVDSPQPPSGSSSDVVAAEVAEVAAGVQLRWAEQRTTADCDTSQDTVVTVHESSFTADDLSMALVEAGVDDMCESVSVPLATPPRLSADAFAKEIELLLALQALLEAPFATDSSLGTLSATAPTIFSYMQA
eukprot:TRINITY_DN11627_c0_g1_i1.p1 TRINITY_DN11627_c0_g1~~TRINITY_DN11627_c0_g1_i1.p1  ORF type:complete len:640 (-),score=160.31 TRINITY_DN11627_c0_g1_i1:65-1984(-)